jgi:subtilisin family serine protease
MPAPSSVCWAIVASRSWACSVSGLSGGYRKYAYANAEGVIVAVIDSGIRYTHEDLVGNLWQNPKESANGADGVDDDGNGIVDDV